VRYASPLDGVVVDRHVTVGDEVEPSGHLLEVADLREVLALGRVFEGQIGQVAVGQAVRVRVPSFPDQEFEGRVERMAGGLDAQSRSLPIYVRVKNTDGRLRPAMRATLDLVTGGAELALAVPKSAVLGEAGQFYVFVQHEDTTDLFERRPVVLGVRNDQYVEILEGVSPGEPVVTQGNYPLQYVAPAAAVEKPGAKPPAAKEAPGLKTAPEPSPETEGVARSALGALWLVGGIAALLGAVLAVAVLRLRPRGRSAHGMR
jgi:RND family efflux transporter MFP subunit